MKIKKCIIFSLSVICLILSSCSSSKSDYIGTRHLPLQFDGTRIYGGMGTFVLSYASTDTGTFAPLCTNPTCTHDGTSTSCEARFDNPIIAYTFDGDNHIIVSVRDDVDPYTYDAIKIDLDTGKREYVVERNPNNISSMMVVKDKLYFTSQIDDGDENEGEHSVCYTSLNGSKVETVSLPEDDYSFTGADENYLYLRALYTQSIIAVDYNDGYEYHTLHSFSENQFPECYIEDGSIYLFNNRVNTTVTAEHDEYPEIDDSSVTRNYPLYTFTKYDIAAGKIVAETEKQYTGSSRGYVSDDYIYLPNFSPVCAAPIENSDGTVSYPVHRNTGVDVIDRATMDAVESIDFGGMDVNAVIYADSGKIVFYGNRYEGELKFYMGWLDLTTNEIHEYELR